MEEEYKGRISASLLLIERYKQDYFNLTELKGHKKVTADILITIIEDILRGVEEEQSTSLLFYSADKK